LIPPCKSKKRKRRRAIREPPLHQLLSYTDGIIIGEQPFQRLFFLQHAVVIAHFGLFAAFAENLTAAALEIPQITRFALFAGHHRASVPAAIAGE